MQWIHTNSLWHWSQQLGLPNAVTKALTRQAHIYDRDKDYTTSLPLYTQAITLMPTNAMWYRNHAGTHIQLKNPEAARLQPAHPYLHLRYGDLALLQYNYAGAIAHYQVIITAQPRNNAGYFGLARTYFGQHQPIAALDALNNSPELTRAPQEAHEALPNLQDMDTTNPLLPCLGEGIEQLQVWLLAKRNIPRWSLSSPTLSPPVSLDLFDSAETAHTASHRLFF